MKAAKSDIRRMAEFLLDNDGFTLITHTSPDGDTLGSALALKHMLERLNKRAQVVCEDRVPKVYAFLPGADDVLSPDMAKATPCAIAVDCADAARMGEAQRLFDAAQRTAVIDHHVTNSGYGGVNLVSATAAAAGELVFALDRLMFDTYDIDACTCIYAAIITDTGNFAYGNTTPESHLIASQLLSSGINAYEINRLIFRTVPYGKKKLLGVALTNMQLAQNGRVGISTLTLAELKHAGASEEDTEGVIDHIRDVDSVEIAILIRECGAGQYKVSLRSKLTADVSAMAGALGGGGHMRAAGYTVHGEMADIYVQALELAQKALEV